MEAPPPVAQGQAAGSVATARSFFLACEAAMPISPYASWMLEQEARALLTRLARVKPFVSQETMLPVAELMPDAQIAIENYLIEGRRLLRGMINAYLDWLRA